MSSASIRTNLVTAPGPRIDASSSDDVLLAAATSSRAAVAILYARHADTLRKAALAVVGKHDATIADDAVNDVFVVLLEGRGATFRPARGRALGWLSAMARTFATEHLQGRTAARLKTHKRRETSGGDL